MKRLILVTVVVVASLCLMIPQIASAGDNPSLGTRVSNVLLASITAVPPLPSGGGGGGFGDTNPPRIYDGLVSGITETTADIAWTTNEKSTSQVEYWASPSKFSPLDETYVINHLVQLTDLIPGTNYSYKTMSEDRAGNLAVSDECSFTTLEGKTVEPEPLPPEPTPPAPEPEPEPAPRPEPAPTPTPEPAPSAFWWIGGTLVFLGVVGFGTWWLLRREKK